MKDALASVAPFVRQYYVESTVWPEGHLENWIKWAAANGYLILTMDDDENTTGLVIARTVNQIPAKSDLEPFDENGEIIYIDFAITPTREIQKALCLGLLQRYGKRPFVAFRHNAHDELPDNVRIHKSDNLLKAFLQLEA